LTPTDKVTKVNPYQPKTGRREMATERVTDTFDAWGKKVTDTFQFTDLAQLRDWLNRFHTTDLRTVFPDDSGVIDLTWIEQDMEDGSSVFNVRIRT
jgi:hypothetical protein